MPVGGQQINSDEAGRSTLSEHPKDETKRQKYSRFLHSRGAKDSLRLAVGVGICAIPTVILYYKADKASGDERQRLQQWGTGCIWGAITVIVINSPILGQCAKNSLERLAGTVIGGWLGYAFRMAVLLQSKAWLPVISVLYALLAATLGNLLEVQGAANLSIITLLSVLWDNLDTGTAMMLMGVRVACISAAIFLVTFLSIIIWPQVASEAAIESLRAAMQITSQLNTAIWEEIQGICSVHHGVIVKSSKHLPHGTACQLRCESAVAGVISELKEERALPRELSEPGDTRVDLEAVGRKQRRWQRLDHLTRRRKERVKRKQRLEAELEAVQEDESEQGLQNLMGNLRSRLAEIPDRMRWALNEVYLGSFFGRRWYLPNTSYYTRFFDKEGWHMPEKAIMQVAFHLHRTTRLLYTIHSTFKDGFRDDVMLAMDHILPVKMLIDLAAAAKPVLEDLTSCLPAPGNTFPSYSPRDPTEHLQKLAIIVRDLVALSKCSFHQKVRLTMLGARAEGSRREEELPSLLPEKDWAAAGDAPGDQPQPVRWCTMCPNTHELFLFPDTPAGYLAQMRWFSFHFLIEDLVVNYEKLYLSLDVTSQLLPGAPLFGPLDDDDHPKAEV